MLRAQPVRSRAREHLATALIVMLLSSFALPAALAQKITTEFDEAVDFGKFKTFLVREGRLNSRHPALNSDLTKKNIATAIETALTDRGLTKATGQPDLNVLYTFGAARQIATETYPAGWRGLGTRVVKTPYAEGTLVIDLRDPTTRSLVWRGIAVEGEKDPEELADRLDKMVEKALKKYPPKK
jgi:uncharacterized protein DUF4136